MQSNTATAHIAWEAKWQSEEGRALWLSPDIDVRWCARSVKRKGGRRALDLGCGVGRHALHFARLGFETYAMDGSPAGIAHLEGDALAAGLDIEARTGLMTDLPYEDGFFDYVLAFNVIYHGDGGVVRRTIAEIERILAPGGTYQGTMLTTRNANYRVGREVSPDTYVSHDPTSDKSHPHFYCNAAGLTGLFAGFEIESLYTRQHEKPGSWHWHLVTRRL